MVLKWLIHFFANNEQFINKLADSYPVRRGAQFAVYLFVTGQEAFGKIRATGLRSIADRYREHIREAKEEFQEAAKEIKKRSNK